MGKLIILRGNSGSGKTTVAKELQKKFGYNTKRILLYLLWMMRYLILQMIRI